MRPSRPFSCSTAPATVEARMAPMWSAVPVHWNQLVRTREGPLGPSTLTMSASRMPLRLAVNQVDELVAEAAPKQTGSISFQTADMVMM